jgi:hypothetical protein
MTKLKTKKVFWFLEIFKINMMNVFWDYRYHTILFIQSPEYPSFKSGKSCQNLQNIQAIILARKSVFQYSHMYKTNDMDVYKHFQGKNIVLINGDITSRKNVIIQVQDLDHQMLYR